MTEFRTTIEIPSSRYKINYASHIMFMGSCFAENIGNRFAERALHSMVNPFGILFNPISVSKSLHRLMDREVYIESDLHQYNGLWHTFDHHSRYSFESKDECLSVLNETLLEGHQFLKKSNFLFVTLGTSWVYRSCETGKVVSNCHKYPSRFFERELVGVESIVKEYVSLIDKLHYYNPTLKVIFTVSPVRHWKDGAHGNQISKANLLLAIDALVNKYDFVDYFPAYEILLDELRDYRFYADDMLHPSVIAIDYIWDKVGEVYFDEDVCRYLSEIKKIVSMLNHKPFNPQSQQYLDLIKSTQMKLQNINERYLNSNVSYLTNKLDLKVKSLE